MISEKWRTIPEFPDYVVSNKGTIASKKGRITTLHRGRVQLGNRRISAVKIFHTVWGNIEGKPIPDYPDYVITKEGQVYNGSGKLLSVSNGLVRLNKNRVTTAFKVVDLLSRIYND